MKGFRMSDEYKKLYASLAVLGSAIKKAEEHIKRSPSAGDVFIDVTEAHNECRPPMTAENEGFRWTLRLADDCDEDGFHRWAGLNLFLANDPDLPGDRKGSCICDLSDLPSDQMVAYSKYLPELIRLTDQKVSELADKAEDYAGEIEQALAMAAKKPVREKKKK
jgi:hypothetical protein